MQKYVYIEFRIEAIQMLRAAFFIKQKNGNNTNAHQLKNE